MIQRTLLEWQTIRHGEGQDAIPAQVADRVAAVAASSPLAGRGGNGVLEHGRRGLRARGVVGIIATQDCTLEILPKIDFQGEEGDKAVGSIRRRLIHMLSIALDMKIEAGQMTSLDWQRDTLLEILVRLFSEKLLDALRHGMPRRYAGVEEDLPALRGRINLTRQFSVLAAEPVKLACRYDVLSSDIALNQIMKAAVARLVRVARNGDNQRRLLELRSAYADIADVPIAFLRWDEVVLDRTNRRWSALLNLARLLLGERFQTTSAGDSSGFSLLFEMNTLFEEYIARSLVRALADQDIRVVSQGGRLYCLETEERRGLFQTRPDILLKRGNAVVQVIDTKWKRVAGRMDDPKQGIAQADVYQMMAYGQLYSCSKLTLLFPHHAGLATSEGIQNSNRITSSERLLEVATIDIATASDLNERLIKIAKVDA